jgi:hypothetical protein
MLPLFVAVHEVEERGAPWIVYSVIPTRLPDRMVVALSDPIVPGVGVPDEKPMEAAKTKSLLEVVETPETVGVVKAVLQAFA